MDVAMARTGFRNHPKFRRLVHLLGVPEPHAYGLCEFLWSVSYESGNPVIGDLLDVELNAGWKGEAGLLCLSLLNCGGENCAGLIEPIGDDYKRISFVDTNSTKGVRFQIHDLHDHAPDYVRRRMAREEDRASNGMTISDVRRKSVSARKDRKLLQTVTNEIHLNPREVTKVRTPSPAPSPAPTPINVTSGDVEVTDASQENGEIDAAAGDILDSEIREYFAGHKMLMWDPKTNAKCRKLVEMVGWSKAKELISKGISAGASFPVGWAVTAAASLENRKAAKIDAGGTGKPLPKTVAEGGKPWIDGDNGVGGPAPPVVMPKKRGAPPPPPRPAMELKNANA